MTWWWFTAQICPHLNRTPGAIGRAWPGLNSVFFLIYFPLLYEYLRGHNHVQEKKTRENSSSGPGDKSPLFFSCIEYLSHTKCDFLAQNVISGVGLAIYRMKKNLILPAPCHNVIRFNLQNLGVDLFPIIFGNFKTWVGLSIPLD